MIAHLFDALKPLLLLAVTPYLGAIMGIAATLQFMFSGMKPEPEPRKARKNDWYHFPSIRINAGPTV